MARDTVIIDSDDDMEEEEVKHARYDSDEEDDEEGGDEFEDDGFIVDDIDEEEEEEERHKSKRKKRASEKNLSLDEDDYELLEENITGFRRPNEEGKKFKRLKKAKGNSDEGPSAAFAGSGKGGRTPKEQLKWNLFGDDEESLFQDIAEDGQQKEVEEDDGLEEEDDIANFIVDEEEADEYGPTMRQKKSNKKKPSKGTGVSSSALQDAYEIFGHVDDHLRRRKEHLEMMNDNNESGGSRLEDEFDPIVLSEKYMTKKDEQIWETDMPERLQMSEESTGPQPTDDASIEEESNWIYNQFVGGMVPFFSMTGTMQPENEMLIDKEDIMRLLGFMHVQKYDIPFIAMYRRDTCLSLFKDPVLQEVDVENQNKDGKRTAQWHKVLWAIERLDKKWLLIQKRKIALQSYYTKRYKEESRRIYDVTRMTLNQQLFESITKSLKAAESEREIDDVDSKFNLHFPPGEVGGGEGSFKRPKRKTKYSICCDAGLWEFASKFGHTSEQFGLQISLEKMRMDELEDAQETPDDMALIFTCAMFETTEAVLKGARHMGAVEISCEPSVRKHVRSIFLQKAVVCTEPTPEGITAIDAIHQYAGVKWLKDKPLTRFDDAQWLLIEKAQEEKLLQVVIKLPEGVLDKLVSQTHEYYLSDGVSKYAQLWNDQRKMILKEALFDYLLPLMEKEARSWLTSKAKNWLFMDYGKLLWDKVSVAPFQQKEKDDRPEDETAPKVMACCWGRGRPSTTFVMLDSYGEVVDTLEAGYLSVRSQSVNDQQRKKNDQARLSKFLIDHKPDLMVLGASNLYCTQLKEDIYEIVYKIVEDNPQNADHSMDNFKIVFGDDTLPRLYENSRISSDQLSSHSGIVRRAVALGRYIQNPIAMIATLCGPGREILSWNLSPLANLLTPDEKYGIVEQIMVDITNQVGLDVNLAITHEWLFSPLQFISGLGPRKAAFLTRSLSKDGAVYSRKDFMTTHHLGRNVFINSVGFLRVRRSGLAASARQCIDFLDDTRIHPESYGLAQDLAKDIYKEDGHGDVDDYDFMEIALDHVREKPELRYFDVDSYATSKSLENKKYILENIKMELLYGFNDWRREYEEPSQDEEFCMISGETDDTLAAGRIVQVKVRRVQEQKAICGLESGLTGMLMSEDYTVGGETDPDLTEKLHEGDNLSCQIKSVQKNRYLVYLSCKENGMRAAQVRNNQERDPFYHEDRNSLQIAQEKSRKDKEFSKKHLKTRMIVHPRFQNITADEAIELLSGKGSGESVFRPSSRGPSYLTLTLKVDEGVYAHKDITEDGKEHKDITSLLSIGKILKIGEETYEDLDEVMDRYADPLATNLKKMLSYRKFRMGTKTEIDELLRIEKTSNPQRIVYCFGISHEHPGSFILTYIRSTNPHHEYIGLYPKGFKFRKRMFEDIDRLVAYFQSHIDDAVPTIRSVSAMAATSAWDGSQSEKNFQDSGSGDGRGRARGRGRGRGRGRSRGSYGGNGFTNDEKDADNGSQKWGAKESDNEWGTNASGGAGGWGSNGGGWGGDGGTGDIGSEKWGAKESGNNTSGGWGGSGGTDDNGSQKWGAKESGSGGWGSSGDGGLKDTNSGGGNSNWGNNKEAGGGGSSGWGGSGGTGDNGSQKWGAKESGSGGWGSSGDGGLKDTNAGGGNSNRGNKIEAGAGGWGGSGGIGDNISQKWGAKESGSGGWGRSGDGGLKDINAGGGNSNWGNKKEAGAGGSGGWGGSGRTGDNSSQNWGVKESSSGGWGSSGDGGLKDTNWGNNKEAGGGGEGGSGWGGSREGTGGESDSTQKQSGRWGSGASEGGGGWGGGKSWGDGGGGGGWSGGGGENDRVGRGRRGRGSFGSGMGNNSDNDGQDTGSDFQKWGVKEDAGNAGGWSGGGLSSGGGGSDSTGGGGWGGGGLGDRGGRGRGRGRGSFRGGMGFGFGNNKQESGAGSGGWSSGGNGGRGRGRGSYGGGRRNDAGNDGQQEGGGVWSSSQDGGGWNDRNRGDEGSGGNSWGGGGWGSSGGGGSKGTDAGGGNTGWGNNKQAGSGGNSWGGGGGGTASGGWGSNGDGGLKDTHAGGGGGGSGWGGSQEGTGGESDSTQKQSGGWGGGAAKGNSGAAESGDKNSSVWGQIQSGGSGGWGSDACKGVSGGVESGGNGDKNCTVWGQKQSDGGWGGGGKSSWGDAENSGAGYKSSSGWGGGRSGSAQQQSGGGDKSASGWGGGDTGKGGWCGGKSSGDQGNGGWGSGKSGGDGNGPKGGSGGWGNSSGSSGSKDASADAGNSVWGSTKKTPGSSGGW